MINRVRTIFTKAIIYLRLWGKETDLSAKQIAKIEDLRKEIKDLDNYDLCPPPTTEFQKIEQLRELDRFTEDFKDIRNCKKFNPQNEELNLLLVEIGNIDFQLIDAKLSRYSSLSESGLKEYFKTQTPQTKTTDKEKELQKELGDLLGGRKELAEELIHIEGKKELKQWIKDHSSELYEEIEVNAKQLYNTLLSLKVIKVINGRAEFTDRTFTNWVSICVKKKITK